MRQKQPSSEAFERALAMKREQTTMPASQPVDYVQVCQQIAGFLDREFSATVVTEVGDLHALASQLTALREAVNGCGITVDERSVPSPGGHWTCSESARCINCEVQRDIVIRQLTHINPRDAHG